MTFNRTATVRAGTSAQSGAPIIDVRKSGSAFYEVPDPYEAGRQARREEAAEASRTESDDTEPVSAETE